MYCDTDWIRPVDGLSASLAEHPLAELIDQAGLFADRNEFVGRDDAAFGGAPSQRGFAGADLSALDIDDRLKINFQAAVDDRLTQFEFQASPRPGAFINAGFEEPVGPPPVALGAV